MPNSDYQNKSSNDLLYYNFGIAGKEAKDRFNNLSVYFYVNFFSEANKHRLRNLQNLQRFVDQMARCNKPTIEKYLNQPPFGPIGGRSGIWINNSTLQSLRDDVYHRVFFYMNF